MPKKKESKEIVVIDNPISFETWLQACIVSDTVDVVKLGEAIEVLKPYFEDVKKMVIFDKDTFDQVDRTAKVLKKLRNLINNLLEPEVKNIYKDYKDKKQILDGFCGPLKAIEDRKKKEMIAYEREMERIRQQAAMKAQREEEERAKLEKERLEKEALEAIDSGDDEKAEELAAQAEEVEAEVPIQQPSYMPPKGTSIKEMWKAEVTDFESLVKAVAGDKAPLACLKPDDVYLGQRARSDKKSLKIPGVRVWDEGSVSMRTK